MVAPDIHGRPMGCLPLRRGRPAGGLAVLPGQIRRSRSTALRLTLDPPFWLQIDVVEPFTKIHRVAVQQPTVFKTAVQDVARVHTSVPVYGKALTPYTVYH